MAAAPPEAMREAAPARSQAPLVAARHITLDTTPRSVQRLSNGPVIYRNHPMGGTFDHIVVGGGSSGCVVAARLRAAVSKTLCATWGRGMVHFMRNALAYASKSGQRVVAAFVATAFAQNDVVSARQQWRRVADLYPQDPRSQLLRSAG